MVDDKVIDDNKPREMLATKINLDTGIIKNLDVNKYKNVLVLCGTYYSLNVFNKYIKPLIKTNCHLFSGLTANPTDSNIYSATSFARSNKIDCIVAVGTASVMDCGRLVSLLLSHGGFLQDYFAGGIIGPFGITSNVVPLITVPTICGSGAEISNSAAFIMNEERKVISSPYLVPKVTYIDPEIMRGIPDIRWAGISFECFATALAAYVSDYANPTSDSFAEAALKDYLTSSIKLINDTNNLDNIKQVEIASINAFIAANFSSYGAAHAIADVLSAKFNIQYGFALAMVCGKVSKLNYEYNKIKYDKVLKFLNCSSKDIETGIKNLIEKLGLIIPHIKEKLTSYDIDQLSRECINYKMRGNPKTLTPVEVACMLKSLS